MSGELDSQKIQQKKTNATIIGHRENIWFGKQYDSRLARRHNDGAGFFYPMLLRERVFDCQDADTITRVY